MIKKEPVKISRRSRMNPKLRLKLIQEVKCMPELYDLNDINYKDNNQRDKAWVHIASRLGENCEVLRHEWKIMRDSYRQALRRRAEDGQAKMWIFEKAMDFLRPNMSKRDSIKEFASPKNDIYFDTSLENASTASFDRTNAGEDGMDESTRTLEVKPFPEFTQMSSNEDNGLELFFASVCQSTTRLPSNVQRMVKKQVLNILIKAEEAAEEEQ